MKRVLFFILILCFTCSILAVDSGDDFQITNIVRCYGVVDIKIWGVGNLTNNGINFKGCKQIEYDKWQCNCNAGHTPVILETKNYTYNIYDVVVEYYIAPKVKVQVGAYDKNSNNKRNVNINNIRVGPVPKEKNVIKFKLPGINIARLFVVVIITLISSLLIATYYIYKYFIKDIEEEDNNIGYFTKKRHKPKVLETGDSELDNVIKKL